MSRLYGFWTWTTTADEPALFSYRFQRGPKWYRSWT